MLNSHPTIQMGKQLLIAFLVSAVIVQSCAAAATPSAPDPTLTSAPEKTFTAVPAKTPTLGAKPTPTTQYFNPAEGVVLPQDVPYVIQGKLDPNLIPEPAEASTTTIEQVNAESGETNTEEANIAVSTSNSDGIAAFNDRRLNLTVPIVVVDEQGQPVDGIEVEYISIGDVILVITSDPIERFAPTTITLSSSELASTAKSDFKTVGLSTVPKLFVITAAVIVGVIAIVDKMLTAKDVIRLAVDPPQFVKVLGKPIQMCASPEQLGHFTGLSLALIPFANQGAKGIKGIVIAASKVVGQELIAWGVAKSLREPILWEHFSPTGVITNRILFRNKRDPDSFQGYWMPIGKCSYVPDVTGKTQEEAEALLSAEHLEFFVTSATGEGKWPSGHVEQQEPGPKHRSPIFGKEVETMLPQAPTSDKGRVNLIISIGQVPTEPPIPDVVEGTVSEGQAYCRYGPGKAYLEAADLFQGDRIQLEGRYYGNTWLWGKPEKLDRHCWVAPSVLDITGDVSTLEFVSPNLPFTPDASPVTGVAATRDGNMVTITWNPSGLASRDLRGYLLEVQVCQNGAFLIMALNPQENFVTIQDDEGCSVASSGVIYVASVRGYSQPVQIPWP